MLMIGLFVFETQGQFNGNLLLSVFWEGSSNTPKMFRNLSKVHAHTTSAPLLCVQDTILTATKWSRQKNSLISL